MFKKSMKQRGWKRMLAGTMSLALLLANLYTVPVLAETSEGETGETVASGEVVDAVVGETAPVENVGDAAPEEGIAVLSAEDGSYTFDAAKELGENGLNMAQGELYAGFNRSMTFADYFTVKGNQLKRAKSGTYSLELSSNFQSYMEFTTNATATVTIEATSTGGSNTSLFELRKGGNTGTAVAEDGEQEGVTGTRKTTLTFTGLEPGTYAFGESEGKRGIRVLSIKVSEEGGAVTKATVTPTITGLAAGQSVVLVKGGNETAITSGTPVELATGTYDLVVKKDGQTDADARATVDGNTQVRIKEDTTAIAVTVASAYVNPIAKLATGSTLAEGNKITLTNKTDANDKIELTSANLDSTVKLTIDATYVLSTESGSKTKATVGSNKTEFKAEAGMTELVIAVESTVVNATVKIFDADSVLSQVTALTLSDGKGFSVDLKTATTVELTIGTKYTLTMTTDPADAELTVALNGGTSVTADKNTTALNVELGKVTEGLYVVDLTGGLLKDEFYADGAISVTANFPYNANGYVKGSSNPKNSEDKTPTTENFLPVSGAAVVVTPKQDGRLKINYRPTKTVFFVTESSVVNTVDGTNGGTVSYKVEAGETYYFYAAGSNIEITNITVDYRPAVDWSTVSTPVVTAVTAARPGDANEGTVTVSYQAQIGGIYSDSLVIQALQNGEIIKEVEITDETSITNDWAGTATIAGLPKSGDYQIQAMLKRSGEATKKSAAVTLTGFILPMATPVIVNAESQGSGNVKFSWQAVTEATSYNVYVDGELAGSTTEVYYRLSKLSAGEHTFAVEAIGNGDVSELASLKAPVTDVAKKNWQRSAFGQGVSSKIDECGSSGSFDGGDLSLWSVKSKGKIVPASTDGLVFYYTTIDAETENFTLEADVVVDEWTFTNGQEGFGLMAADRVGINGDASVFWNNSYMLSGTKVEYLWDSTENRVSDSGKKYSMKMGIGAQEKTGVTPENLSGMEDGSAINDFRTNMYTLETSAATTLDERGDNLIAGTYNIVGNYAANEEMDGYTLPTAATTFHMVLQRNNTGYFLSYTDANDVTTTKKFYHGDDGDELAKLDPNNIYVGFFASRTCKISVKNATLTVVAPENDAPKEERPIEYVSLKAGFESSKTSNSSNYELVYYGNTDGMLTISDEEGTVVTNYPVKANEKARFNMVLHAGLNEFSGFISPNKDFKPSKYELLDNYSGVDFYIKVTYNPNYQNIHYVCSDPSVAGDGTKEHPQNIYAAIYDAKPGDRILLMEGTYNLTQNVVIDRGMNGTENAKIYMIADPEAKTRPVLDFNNYAAGLTLAGDYWYLQGFDVTRSTGKGVQVSGDNNIVDNVRAYRNKNTGIQIARYMSSDTWEDWPSNNLILNCTSYLNADPGYEDADGFTAKLTVADGNVFDGCISAYNADDGWDLFAKIESGPIGKVTIRNCVAFKNGYDIAEDGSEINAGNGNGFKMGGSSITGYHLLENSVAFANKAKGIDSNSCPDIQVKNSTSFNNESNNVAFYTNDAKNTDFAAEGIISYKTEAVGDKGYKTGENFKFKGTQEESKVKNATNYYWNGSKSSNTAKVTVADDWFVNLDVDAAINGGITRNADGTINMNGFLELTDKVPADAGARLEEAGMASEEVTIPEFESSYEDEDSGSGSAGGGAAGYITDVDWAAVEALEDAAVKTKKAQNVNVNAGDRYEVPVSVLNKIASTKVTLGLHSGDGITLSISGTDFKKATAPFRMAMSHEDVIPADVANQVLATATTSKSFAMADRSAYPFRVHVHANLGKENAGKMAYLYYYDEQSKSMVVAGSFRITADGQAMFAIYRGDEYIIAVSDKAVVAKGKYVVQKGDTLTRIAGRAGTTLKKLVTANPQIKNIDLILPGQQINLQ